VERKRFSDLPRSLARCPEVVGEWQSMLILRDAILGVSRFDQFHERLGISRNVLNQCLASDHPLRHGYRLTDKVGDLWPVLTTLRQWGDEHAVPDGPPLQVIHKSCNQISDAVLTCSASGESIGARAVRAVPGSGAVETLAGSARSGKA